MQVIYKTISTLLSMSGVISGHMTLSRVIIMVVSFIFSTTILPKYNSSNYAVSYFVLTTLVYMAVIFILLSEYSLDLRKKWIEKYGEERAFIAFETILTFTFFHNAVSLTFLSQSSSMSISVNEYFNFFIQIIAIMLYIFSNVVAVWSAYVLGIPLYFWKDMFLNKKVQTLVKAGPYKYFNNPIYGIGRLQYYAIALYYGSLYGLIAAIFSQMLLYTFFYTVEYPFIKRLYFKNI